MTSVRKKSRGTTSTPSTGSGSTRGVGHVPTPSTTSDPFGNPFAGTGDNTPGIGTWTSKDEYVGAGRYQGFNSMGLFEAWLKSMSQSGSVAQSFSAILDEFYKMILVEGKTQFSPDQLISLMQSLMSYSMTVDQRQYDRATLDESRNYNSPTNELARLMGAGVSRDAAIQMLSGNGAAGAGTGSAAATPVASPVAGAGAANLNGSNAQANMINEIYNGFQLVANLCQQGVDMYSSIQTAQMLNTQNYMTQQQRQSFDAVNQITSALQNAVTQGIIEPADLEGWSDANDVYKWLLDHTDTNLVKPLVDNGSMRGVFGSTLGREMFNKHWAQMRESKDAGKLFDNYLRQSELSSDLAAINTASARRQFYTDFVSSLQNLIMNDENIALLWQQYQDGQVVVKIHNEELKQQQYRTNAAARQDATDQVYFDAFNDALNSEIEIPNGDTVTGRDVINYHVFSGLIKQYMSDAALTGNDIVTWRDSDGNVVAGSQAKRFAAYLESNAAAAITGAFVQELINGNHLIGLTGDFSPIYQFFDLWNNSGASSFVTSTAAGVGGVSGLLRAFK